MSNLAFNMQRMVPFMQRCGDLLQRESLLASAEHRRQTTEMTVAVGAMMEELAKATGSAAHLYKTMDLGPQPGASRLDTQAFDPMFAAVIAASAAAESQQEVAEPE